MIGSIIIGVILLMLAVEARIERNKINTKLNNLSKTFEIELSVDSSKSNKRSSLKRAVNIENVTQQEVSNEGSRLEVMFDRLVKETENFDNQRSPKEKGNTLNNDSSNLNSEQLNDTDDAF